MQYKHDDCRISCTLRSRALVHIWQLQWILQLATWLRQIALSSYMLPLAYFFHASPRLFRMNHLQTTNTNFRTKVHSFPYLILYALLVLCIFYSLKVTSNSTITVFHIHLHLIVSIRQKPFGKCSNGVQYRIINNLIPS